MYMQKLRPKKRVRCYFTLLLFVPLTQKGSRNMSRKQSWNSPSSAETNTYSKEQMTVEELKKYVRSIPTERENTNRLLRIGCGYQKGLKCCIMEKGKWETYLESLKLVDDGEESSDIDIGDFMPASWCATNYLAT